MKADFWLLVVAAALPLSGCYQLDCSFDNSCPANGSQLTLKVTGTAEIDIFAPLTDLTFTAETFFPNEQHIVAELTATAQRFVQDLPGQAPTGNFTISGTTLQEKIDFRKLRCGYLAIQIHAVEDQDKPGTYFQNSNVVSLPIKNGLPDAVVYASSVVNTNPLTKIGFHSTAPPPYSVYVNFTAPTTPPTSNLSFGQLTSRASPSPKLTFTDYADDFQFVGETDGNRLVIGKGAVIDKCNSARLLTCEQLMISNLADSSQCLRAMYEFPWCFPALASDVAQNGKFLANISGSGDLYVDELVTPFDPSKSMAKGSNCRAVAVGDLDDDQHADVLALRANDAPVIYLRNSQDNGFSASAAPSPSTDLAAKLYKVAPELGHTDAVVAIGQLPGSLSGSYLVGASQDKMFILIPSSGDRCPFSLPDLMPSVGTPITAITLAKTQIDKPADLLLVGNSGNVHVYTLAVTKTN